MLEIIFSNSETQTCIIRDTGPLAASWRAEHICAVHQVTLIVLTSLCINDGDIRDNGDCRRGGKSH